MWVSNQYHNTDSDAVLVQNPYESNKNFSYYCTYLSSSCPLLYKGSDDPVVRAFSLDTIDRRFDSPI